MRGASRFVSGFLACGITAAAWCSAIAGSPSAAQCGACGLAPATYSGHADGSSSNYVQSTVGPYIDLTSAGAQSLAGELDGEPWPGPGISDQAEITVDSTHSLGIVQSYARSSAPTQPDPNLWDGDYSYDAYEGAGSGGSLGYQLYIEGPAPTVEVLVNANGFVEGSPNLGATEQVLQSIFDVRGPGADIYDAVTIDYGSSSNSSSTSGPGAYIMGNSEIAGLVGGFQDDNVYTFNTDTLYDISLTVETSNSILTSSSGDVQDGSGEGEFIAGGSVTDHAFVDPTYQIAPGTPDADQYTIYFSPGVSNAVPEPSTWAMLLFGFGGLTLARSFSQIARRASG
jgi:PEP-CTERM motif